jgi:hypothetical protein
MAYQRIAHVLIAFTTVFAACTTKEIVHQSDDDDTGSGSGGFLATGGSTETGTLTATTGPGSGGAPTGPGSGGAPSTTTTTSTGSSMTNCAAQPTFDLCYDCFANQNPAGANAFTSSVVQACFCENECQTSCTAECADPSVLMSGTPCNNCFTAAVNDPNSGCQSDYANYCGASAPCVQFVNDVQSCPP